MGRSFFAASGSHGHKAQASTRRRSRHPSPGWMIMKTALQCLALMALAESAAAFAPSSSFLPRHPLLSAATCSIRAQPPAKQGGARAAPLRLGGLRLAVSSAPVTISGTNIELTDALKKYVNDKVGSAIDKVGKKVTGCDVTLKVDKDPSVEKNQEIEIVMSVKGTVLRTALENLRPVILILLRSRHSRNSTTSTTRLTT